MITIFACCDLIDNVLFHYGVFDIWLVAIYINSLLKPALIKVGAFYRGILVADAKARVSMPACLVAPLHFAGSILFLSLPVSACSAALRCVGTRPHTRFNDHSVKLSRKIIRPYFI